MVNVMIIDRPMPMVGPAHTAHTAHTGTTSTHKHTHAHTRTHTHTHAHTHTRTHTNVQVQELERNAISAADLELAAAGNCSIINCYAYITYISHMCV